MKVQIRVGEQMEETLHLQSKGIKFNRNYGMAIDFNVSTPARQWLAEQKPTVGSLHTGHNKYYIEGVYYERKGFPRLQIKGTEFNRSFGATLTIKKGSTAHLTLQKFERMVKASESKSVAKSGLKDLFKDKPEGIGDPFVLKPPVEEGDVFSKLMEYMDEAIAAEVKPKESAWDTFWAVSEPAELKPKKIKYKPVEPDMCKSSCPICKENVELYQKNLIKWEMQEASQK